MKISKRSQQDFEFFLNTELDMIGNLVGVKDHRDNPNGATALECWYQRDTHGKTLPCREIGALQKAERGKQSWNLQVKLWAEDVADGMLLRQPELLDYCHGAPLWIFEATMNQAGSIVKKQRGFVPRFARLERVFGQWWPVEMDAFDAAI